MNIADLLNKENLKIARENGGYSTVAATSLVSSSKKDLVEKWESGELVPTMRQVESLAKQYQVSLLLLLSDQPIPKHRSIPDYRGGDQNIGKEKINKLINFVVNRQGWLERKLSGIGYVRNDLIGSGKRRQTPEALAQFIIEKLGINHNVIVSFSGQAGRGKTLDYLTELLENNQIFVGKTLSHHKIAVSEMRGLFINNERAPFIVLNRKDAVAAQIFTLMHEVAHLFRATEGISKADFRTLDAQQKVSADPEEIFCNATAACILIPAELIQDSNYKENEVRSLAAQFNVSNLFAFYRLKSLKKIQKEHQDYIEKIFVAESAEAVRQKEIKDKQKNGGNHVNNMRDSNGGLFNRLVVDFYSQNDIGYSEASNVLKFSVEQV